MVAMGIGWQSSPFSRCLLFHHVFSRALLHDAIAVLHVGWLERGVDYAHVSRNFLCRPL